MSSPLKSQYEDHSEHEEEPDPISQLRRANTRLQPSFTDDFSPPIRSATDLSGTYRPRQRFGPITPLPKPPSSSSLRTMPTVEKRLCDFCQNTIITADQKWGLHHESFAALHKSAQKDCNLCIQLFEDVNKAHPTDPEMLEWPLYRWNIRNPQRIGDTGEVFAAVVFRQAVSIGPSIPRTKCEAEALPERTFLLFQQTTVDQMQPLHSLGNHTFSTETQHTIRNWISQCSANHPDCQGQADKHFVPTRLLDVSHKDRVFCVESRAKRLREPYVTLSYSWGGTRFLVLTRENVDRFMNEGIELRELPRSIAQAVEITRKLGLRYIWVDSLCIMQGADGDFAYEASLMLQVYRNSYCNLAAADTRGADDGIFRTRDPKKLFDAECRGRPNSKIFGNSVWRIVPKALWDEQVLSASLNMRGWVFQERLLSPRLLHFTRTQVFWDCATLSACETFPQGLPEPLDTGSNDRYWRWKLQDTSDLQEFLPTIVDNSLEQFWRQAIRVYTSCKLTYGSDKLIAIWGIASFLISALKETYGVGLWERNLEEQLAWHVVACRQVDGKPSERPKPLRAPTWSWASIDGVIQLPDRFAEVRDYQVVGHDGKPIAFELASWKGESDPHLSQSNARMQGPRTWSEQLKEYAYLLERLDELRQSSSHQKDPPANRSPFIPGDLSAIPRLATNSIPIQGHIGTARLRKVHQGAEWSLFFPRFHLGAEGAVVAAFPDIEPLVSDSEILFLVLAMNMVYTESQDSVNFARQTSTDRIERGHVETCSGIGILIERAETPGHFYRTGAVRWTGLNLVTLRGSFRGYQEVVKIDAEYNAEMGCRIWLD